MGKIDPYRTHCPPLFTEINIQEPNKTQKSSIHPALARETFNGPFTLLALTGCVMECVGASTAPLARLRSAQDKALGGGDQE